jgi:hypothetical protein
MLTLWASGQESTIGAAFLTKTLPEQNVKFEIWYVFVYVCFSSATFILVGSLFCCSALDVVLIQHRLGFRSA